jgi:hypothetical protein
MKVLVSRYQSIDMHCIALPVKFDDGLSEKKATLYKKNGGSKVYIFKKFQFSKTFQSPKTLHLFFASHFPPEWDRQPAFKFNMDLDALLIYRLIPCFFRCTRFFIVDSVTVALLNIAFRLPTPF